MSGNRAETRGRLLINAELSEKLDHFQTALDARLLTIPALEKNMMVFGVALATCMEVGATTAVNVILPDMEGNVGASADEASWVITVYSTAFLCSLPLSVWFARRLGHRNHLVFSILLYALGALGCFLSHELSFLLFSRVVMGFGGGGLLARGLVTLYRLFQGKARAKHALLFASVITSSKAVMPLCFGALTDWISWNTAFLVLVDIAIAAAAVIFLFMPQNLAFHLDSPPPDVPGLSFLIAGVIAFQILVSRGEQDNWFGSMPMRVAFVIGLLCLAAFAWRDSNLKNPNPLLNLRLIVTERPLSAGLGVAIVLGAMLSGSLYVLPQYLRSIEGYSATQTGGFFLVDGLATVAGANLAINLMRRMKLTNILLGAFLIFALGNFAFVYFLTGDTPGVIICLILILHGFSIGMLLPGVSNLLLGQIDSRLLSFGAAIFLCFRQLGVSIGVSAVVAWIDVRQTLHSSRLLDTANRLDPNAAQLTRTLTGLLHGKGLTVNAASLGADQLFSGLVNTQARLLAFIDVFWALQFLGLVGVAFLVLHRGVPHAAKTAPKSEMPQAQEAIQV